MDIILVRHGARRPGEGQLSEHGQHQARLLSRALRLRDCTVDGYFSSASQHAVETARILQPDRGKPVHELDVLTPHCGLDDVDTLIEQAQGVVPDLARHRAILLVGHEGRLSNLVAELTGTRSRPLEHGEVVCIRGTCLADLVAGRGVIHFRYPTYEHQEQQLLAKVQSKMTVSALLAGFVFAALIGLLVDIERWMIPHVVAMMALASALALFVACVYIYDQLGMPSGFWTDGAKPRLWRPLYERRERLREQRWQEIAEEEGAEAADDVLRPQLMNGPRYDAMVTTSRLVFTPAAWLGLVGFLALLTGTRDPRMLVGGGLGLLVAGGYALSRRPDLGAD